MRDEEFKVVALFIIGFLAIVAVYPYLLEHSVFEPYSEIAILGSNKKLGGYPKEVTAGQEFSLFIFLGNHEGSVEYFRVLAKLGTLNSTIDNNTPMNAPVLSEWDFILSNESNSTSPITLTIPSAGLNQRLVFELYQYNTNSGSFDYQNRWTQLWLNVTEPLF